MDNMNMSHQSPISYEASEVPEGGASQLAVKWDTGVLTGNTTFVDVAEWQDGPDHLYKRSDIVHAIIHNQSIQHLEDILSHGWDVNEVLDIPTYVYKWHNSVCGYHLERFQSTALLEAIKNWKEVVEILLKAGADCNLLTPTSLSPLEQALSKPWSSDDKQDIIRLLLKHGANPKIQSNTSKGIVALAIKNKFGIKIVELLLQNGAHPNGRTNEEGMMSKNSSLANVLNLVVANIPRRSSYNDRWTELVESNIVFFKMLLDYGADINYTQEDERPLVHGIMSAGDPYFSISKPLFLPDHLDIVFQHGGDIDAHKYGEKGSALESAVECSGQSNSIRWLLRHGADTTSLRMKYLKKHIIPFQIRLRRYTRLMRCIIMNETLLVLLKAGMRVSPGVRFQLSEIKRTIEGFLKQVHNEGPSNSIREITDNMWAKVHNADVAHAHCERNCQRMTISSLDRIQQNADLQEFSDESLNVYPENEFIETADEQWQYSVKTLQKILDFLSQPRTLQVGCRCCIRDSLVSLHPSVVKTLPGPARLKRYILCHEL